MQFGGLLFIPKAGKETVSTWSCVQADAAVKIVAGMLDNRSSVIKSLFYCVTTRHPSHVEHDVQSITVPYKNSISKLSLQFTELKIY